jgi:hypothetical protein
MRLPEGCVKAILDNSFRVQIREVTVRVTYLMRSYIPMPLSLTKNEQKLSKILVENEQDPI